MTSQHLHMHNPVIPNWCTRTMQFLVLMFPAVMNLKHGVSTTAYLMGAVSLIILINNRPRLNLNSKIIFAGFVVMLAASAVSLLNSADMENSLRRLKYMLHLLLIVPILPALSMIRKDLFHHFLAGACIGTLVTLSISVYQFYYLGYPRATGFYNLIMFGCMVVLLGLTQFIGLFSVKVNKLHLVTVTLAMAFSIYCAILSGARGSWIGFLAGVPLGILLLRKSFPAGKLIGAVLLVVILTVSAGLVANKVLTQRVQATANYISNSPTLEERRTGIGIRLLLWKAALIMWQRHPVIGSGIGDFRRDFEEMAANDIVSSSGILKTEHTYAHSIIFESLAGSGIIGFLSMMTATVVLPIFLFLQGLKRPDNKDLFAAVYGIVFIAAFFMFGLTENWAAHKQLVLSYTILLAIMGSRFALKHPIEDY